MHNLSVLHICDEWTDVYFEVSNVHCLRLVDVIMLMQLFSMVRAEIRSPARNSNRQKCRRRPGNRAEQKGPVNIPNGLKHHHQGITYTNVTIRF